MAGERAGQNCNTPPCVAVTTPRPLGSAATQITSPPFARMLDSSAVAGEKPRRYACHIARLLEGCVGVRADFVDVLTVEAAHDDAAIHVKDALRAGDVVARSARC